MRECSPLAISVVLHIRNPVPPTDTSWIPVPVASEGREIEPRSQVNLGTESSLYIWRYYSIILPKPMTRFKLNASSSDRVDPLELSRSPSFCPYSN